MSSSATSACGSSAWSRSRRLDHCCAGQCRGRDHRVDHERNSGIQTILQSVNDGFERWGHDDYKEDEKPWRAGFHAAGVAGRAGDSGLLAAIVGPQVIKYLSSSRTQTAQIQVKNIASSLQLFRLDVGRYPNQQEGLGALVKQEPGVPTGTGLIFRRLGDHRSVGTALSVRAAGQAWRSRCVHARL